MKRFLLIFISVGTLSASVVRAQLVITNHTFLVNFDDSKATGIYGNRLIFFRFSDYILMNPQWVISCRDHSRSGGSTWEMLTNRVQSGGLPDWFATRGTTNFYAFYTGSDNATTASNTWYSNAMDFAQAPSKTYDLRGNFTNDFPGTTNLFSKVYFADGVSQSADAGSGIGLGNFGISNAAVANGYRWVDSWGNVAAIQSAIYATNQAYGWFNTSGHPDNIIQFLEFLTDRKSMGEDSNVFTAVLDWNSTTPSQTNHCAVTGISQSGGTFSFTFRADRMAGGYYHLSASQTNDCTPAFGLLSGSTNYVCEILRVTNLPTGNYNVFEDGYQILTNFPSSRIASGINLYTDVHSGAMQNQKDECLGELCDMAHVNRTNASDVLPFNALWTDYGSFASVRWPTNSGMTDYTTLMQDKEADLIAEDQIIHANAQPTNHTFTVALTSTNLFVPAPFR